VDLFIRVRQASGPFKSNNIAPACARSLSVAIILFLSLVQNDLPPVGKDYTIATVRHRDPVSPELREQVLRRDGRCFLSRPESLARFGPHACQTRFNRKHPPYATNLLEIEHFHLHAQGTYGKRAQSSLRTCVALCGYANYQGPSEDMRDAMREYTAGLYPDKEPDE